MTRITIKSTQLLMIVIHPIPLEKKLRQNLSTTSELSCGQIDCITYKGKNNALIQSSSTDGDSLPAQPVSTSVVRGSHPGGLEQPS